MSMYLGDFLEDATVYIPFTTNASDGTRADFSASLEEADIVVLKDGAAMTLDSSSIVISTSLGSRVGFHVVAIDMSVDADFTIGAEYAAVLYPSDETVDSKEPVGVLATWSCQNRTVDVGRISGDSAAADNAESFFDGTGYGEILQRTTIATLASQTSFTLTAGSADNDAYNDCTIVIQDASTAAQKAIGIVKDYTGSTKTVTLLADPGIFTMAANDIVTILAPDFLTRYIAAACTAVLSGAGTGTETVKGVDGSTTRLTVTADSSGNRTAVTYG